MYGRVFCIIFARIKYVIMNTKLTLTVEQTIIERAKLYARAKGRSLSDIIENYLKMLTSEQKVVDEISPLVKSLRGSFKDSKSFDYKEELTNELSKKYLS